MLANRVDVLFGDAVELIVKMKNREDAFFISIRLTIIKVNYCIVIFIN